MIMTNPDFGDYEIDDVWDTVPADPQQVAMRIHRYRRYLGQLAGEDPGDFFDLSEDEQQDAVDVGRYIVDWVHDHEESERSKLAKAIHDFRRTIDGTLPVWKSMNKELRDLAEAITAALADWLIRQGAWR